MCSTHRQRYFLGEKENRVARPFTGKVRMLLVALNYEGSDSPLNCTIDAERLVSVAKQAKVKDITRLYDTDRFGRDNAPTADNVRAKIKEIGARTGVNDYFVLCFSGHGDSEENPEAPSGVDCLLCLQGEDTMIDDEIASLITTSFPSDARVLMLCDACHSGGIMDVDTGGVWGRMRVSAISGCQEYQTSVDTGDGGVMTNALLKCINRKTVKALRKRRAVSVQYVFNRMVEFVDEEQDDDDDEYESDDESWDSEYEDYEDDEDEYEDSEFEDEEESGQNINLSWPGGCDPSRIAFPF